MNNELIERARELAGAATPGPWTAILGSGEHQCTAIMAERPHPLANIFIADLLPDWALREMVVPKDHIPNLKFLEASRELVPALCDEVARVTDERDAWFSWAVKLGKKVGCIASTFPDSNSHISDAIDRLISSRGVERMAITEYLNEIDGVRQVYRRIDLSNSEIEEAMFRESAAIETLRRAASGCEMNTNDEYKVQSPDALEVERLREDLARWESGETFSQHAAEIYENLRAQLAAVQAERDALEAAQAENARMREALAEVLRVHDAATSPDLHYHLCPQWRGVHGKCNCGADKAIENARAAMEPRP